MTPAQSLAIPMALAPLIAGSASPGQRFRSGVTVEVSVTRGDRPVGGLSLSDFEVADNAVRQTILAVAPGSCLRA